MLEILSIKNKANKYLITFEDNAELLLVTDVMIKHDLYVGKKVSVEKLTKDNDYFIVLDKAIRKCLKPLTVNETLVYLNEIILEETLKNRVLKTLKEYFLDDKKIIELITFNKNYSKRQLKEVLEKRLVHEELIISYLKEYDESIACQIIFDKQIRIYLKKYSQKEALNKTLKSLKRKGFESLSELNLDKEN